LLPSLGLPVPDHAGVLQALKRYQSALCLDTAIALMNKHASLFQLLLQDVRNA